MIKHALLHAAGDIVTPDCLPEHLFQTPPSPDSADADPNVEAIIAPLVRRLLQKKDTAIYALLCDAVDRAILQEVLRYVRGNQVEAARVLGISRTTMRMKLKNLGRPSIAVGCNLPVGLTPASRTSRRRR